jgi:RimJ/RimL family protein N-acetyltransferase
MIAMSQLQQALPAMQINLKLHDFQSLGMTPWFSYRVGLPERPVPTISERPQIKTKRLVVRPFLPSDLGSLYDLRRCSEIQLHSKMRGRIDHDKLETQRNLDTLNHHEQNHWYFGAFLQSTGELIGEGGLPDIFDMATSASGWPEAEFLIKPGYWRQGYGTEFFKAVIDSWWDLPRERRRHQLIPALVADKEPGDDVSEGVVFQWEEGNMAAQGFFAKVLGQAPVTAEGAFESIDVREGREGQLIRWTGTLIANPRPQADEAESKGSPAE